MNPRTHGSLHTDLFVCFKQTHQHQHAQTSVKASRLSGKVRSANFLRLLVRSTVNWFLDIESSIQAQEVEKVTESRAISTFIAHSL